MFVVYVCVLNASLIQLLTQQRCGNLIELHMSCKRNYVERRDDVKFNNYYTKDGAKRREIILLTKLTEKYPVNVCRKWFLFRLYACV